MNNHNIISKIYWKYSDIEIIFLTKFGSHLYGTDTPDSDTDYKGVFMPSKRMICLGRIPHSINNNKKKAEGEKNSSEDIDCELWSLQYFIEQACEGQTGALDILHANEKNIIKSSSIWENIIKYRDKFYTKNLEAFVGYARKQASKYGIRGSRISVAKNFLQLIEVSCPDFDINNKCKMKDIWDELPLTEHSRYIETNKNEVQQYEINGKIIQETVTLGYAYDIVNKYLQQYGERAKRAERNENIDWKAISHALRAAYQVKQILTEGTITFPLREADFLRDVKQGKLHYLNEVAPILEALMSDLEILSQTSKYPEKCNTEFWNDFVERNVYSYLKNKM